MVYFIGPSSRIMKQLGLEVNYFEMHLTFKSQSIQRLKNKYSNNTLARRLSFRQQMGRKRDKYVSKMGS